MLRVGEIGQREAGLAAAQIVLPLAAAAAPAESAAAARRPARERSGPASGALLGPRMVPSSCMLP